MPIINKVPHKKININLQGAIGIPSTDANILIIGHRHGVLSGAQPNYPQLKLYQKLKTLLYRYYKTQQLFCTITIVRNPPARK